MSFYTCEEHDGAIVVYNGGIFGNECPVCRELVALRDEVEAAEAEAEGPGE